MLILFSFVSPSRPKTSCFIRYTLSSLSQSFKNSNWSCHSLFKILQCFSIAIRQKCRHLMARQPCRLWFLCLSDILPFYPVLLLHRSHATLTFYIFQTCCAPSYLRAFALALPSARKNQHLELFLAASFWHVAPSTLTSNSILFVLSSSLYMHFMKFSIACIRLFTISNLPPEHHCPVEFPAVL